MAAQIKGMPSGSANASPIIYGVPSIGLEDFEDPRLLCNVLKLVLKKLKSLVQRFKCN